MGLRYKKYSLRRGVYSVKTKTAIVLSSLGLLLGSGGGLALANLGSASAAVSTNYTLFGAATSVSGGNPGNAVQMVSNTGNQDLSDDYGGIDFTGQTGGTLSSLTTLSTDYEVTSGDCGGGSPRFQLNIGGHNVFVYIGPSPNYTGCTVGSWQSTGNLVTSPDARFDTSQYTGGNFYSTYAQAVSLLGSEAITGVQLVTDGGWAVGGNQTVLADNTQINDTTYTYEPAPTKDNCKNDGWKTMTDASGKKFKNQGDCVSYFATNGKNTAAGPKKGTSQAAGNLTLADPTQTLNFVVHDNGTSAVDLGSVTYSNPGAGLTYTVPTTCVNVTGNTAYFAYQIPSTAPVAANVWVVWKVVDNGASDIAGFTTAADGPSANALCEAGSASVTNYPITTGDVKVL